ncbi:MAG: hypothetical protein IKS63_01945, partial [Firmicutes bacterium]|nr:hypothetical protein [Bacillota bacterium]
MAEKGIINISGVSDSQVAPLAAEIIKEKKGQCLFIVSSLVRAKRLATDLSFFTGRKTLVLPEEEGLFIPYEARDHRLLQERINVLKAVEQDPECIVVAPVMGAVRKMPPAETFRSRKTEIEQGGDLDPEAVKEDLSAMGYERLPLVDGMGQFAVRGSIIDIFPPDAENPVRIELFDTEVDSIRTFDMDTQRSIETLERVTVYPAEQIVRDEEIFSGALEKIDKVYSKRIASLKRKKADAEIIKNLENKKEQIADYIKENANIPQLENYIGY